MLLSEFQIYSNSTHVIMWLNAQVSNKQFGHACTHEEICEFVLKWARNCEGTWERVAIRVEVDDC